MAMQRSALVVLILVGLSAENARAQEGPAPGSSRPPSLVSSRRTVAPRTTPDFGTTDASYYRVGAVEFDPDQTGQYTSTWQPPFVTDYLRFGAATWFLAVPHLPGGALLTSLELDDCDTNTIDKHVLLELWDCDYIGQCGAAPIAAVSSVNNAQGFQCGFVGANLSALNYTVDNNLRQLLLFANLQSDDGSNQIAGAIIGYKLQVSPAPATATFGDVPTNHPFFQFVEALAASGITGGCGSGNYCPNSPVTRGQMAVFLAKALGLHFTN